MSKDRQTRYQYLRTQRQGMLAIYVCSIHPLARGLHIRMHVLDNMPCFAPRRTISRPRRSESSLRCRLFGRYATPGIQGASISNLSNPTSMQAFLLDRPALSHLHVPVSYSHAHSHSHCTQVRPHHSICATATRPIEPITSPLVFLTLLPHTSTTGPALG